MAIFVKRRGGNPLTLRAVYCIENHTPLGDINRGVLKEVVQKDLETETAFNSDAEKWRKHTSLNSRPLLS
jgi:hypothetical protein